MYWLWDARRAHTQGHTQPPTHRHRSERALRSLVRLIAAVCFSLLCSPTPQGVSCECAHAATRCLSSPPSLSSLSPLAALAGVRLPPSGARGRLVELDGHRARLGPVVGEGGVSEHGGGDERSSARVACQSMGMGMRRAVRALGALNLLLLLALVSGSGLGNGRHVLVLALVSLDDFLPSTSMSAIASATKR